jgi:hypothetical protein
MLIIAIIAPAHQSRTRANDAGVNTSGFHRKTGFENPMDEGRKTEEYARQLLKAPGEVTCSPPYEPSLVIE